MKTTCKIPPLKNKDNTEATTPKEKAETLNTSFSGNLTDERSQHIPNDSEDFVREFLDSFVIHPDDVMERIRKLHPGKTPGPDGWHPINLKNVADIVSTPLSVFFQMSLSESIVPSHWLQAYMAWVNPWLIVFRHLPRVPLYSVVVNIMKFYRHDRDSNPGRCDENQTCNHYTIDRPINK